MLASLVLAFSPTGACAGQPPNPFEPAPPSYRNLTRQHLESLQRWRRRTEANIEMFRDRLRDDVLPLGSELAQRTREAIVTLGAHLEWLKEREREVAGELGISLLPTAPAPRAKTRPLAPMPRRRHID